MINSDRVCTQGESGLAEMNRVHRSGMEVNGVEGNLLLFQHS